MSASMYKWSLFPLTCSHTFSCSRNCERSSWGIEASGGYSGEQSTLYTCQSYHISKLDNTNSPRLLRIASCWLNWKFYGSRLFKGELWGSFRSLLNIPERATSCARDYTWSWLGKFHCLARRICWHLDHCRLLPSFFFFHSFAALWQSTVSSLPTRPPQSSRSILFLVFHFEVQSDNDFSCDGIPITWVTTPSLVEKRSQIWSLSKWYQLSQTCDLAHFLHDAAK